ncbi:hypothetical protein VPHD51_0067 [Vibrio phage D51]
MSHITHELVRNVTVRLTKEGRKEYYGTAGCKQAMVAEPYGDCYKVSGRILLANGACERLIDRNDYYLFEENEVEIL